jgi:hypothetical protein
MSRPSGEIATLRSVGSITSACAGGGTIAKRETCGGPGRMRSHVTVAAAAAPTRSAAAMASHDPSRLRAGVRSELPAGVDETAGTAGAAVDASDRKYRATEISGMRALRSFTRHRFTTSPRFGGTSGGSRVQSGSLLMTLASVSPMSSPSKGLRPVSISNSTQPNAQTSLRLSADRPFACSGLMYAAVPMIIPARVDPSVIVGESSIEAVRSGSMAFARPKSSTLTTPSGVMAMLAGFRSRWTMPLSWAASSASTIWRAMERVSSIGRARLKPDTTRNGSAVPFDP